MSSSWHVTFILCYLCRLGQVFLSVSHPRVAFQKRHLLIGLISLAHHQTAVCRMGWWGNVQGLSAPRPLHKRKSWREVMGGALDGLSCPLPVHGIFVSRWCTSAGHNGISDSEWALFLSICVVWHRLPVSLRFPCISLLLKARLCSGYSSLFWSGWHFLLLGRRKWKPCACSGQARDIYTCQGKEKVKGICKVSGGQVGSETYR